MQSSPAPSAGRWSPWTPTRRGDVVQRAEGSTLHCSSPSPGSLAQRQRRSAHSARSLVSASPSPLRTTRPLACGAPRRHVHGAHYAGTCCARRRDPARVRAPGAQCAPCGHVARLTVRRGAWLPLRPLPRRPWAGRRTPGSSRPRGARGAPRGLPAASSPRPPLPSWRVSESPHEGGLLEGGLLEGTGTPPVSSPLRKPSSPAPTFPASATHGPRCHRGRSGDVGARDLPVSWPVGALGGPDRP